MIENLKELKEKFENIKKRGYIRSTRNGTTGIGKTFEDLIGKEEDLTSNPDYKGIEIKTKKAYSKTYTTLFNLTPKGNTDYEIKRLKNTYGYPDHIIKSEKVLMKSIFGNTLTCVSNHFLFKLDVNKNKNKVYLKIFDCNLKLIEESVYWEFSELKERLERKLSYLAYIKAYDTTRNNENYYKYVDLKFYKLKGFDEFINLIENGKIRVTFKIGINRTGDNIGEIHDWGTSFQIKECDLLDLFESIRL